MLTTMRAGSIAHFTFSFLMFLRSAQRYLLIVSSFCVFATANPQEKLPRSASFFGFHFDFHATEKDKELGGRFDTDILKDFLKRTKPDFIQIDSKGHPGYSSYPTKVGYSANSFAKDPLRIW